METTCAEAFFRKLGEEEEETGSSWKGMWERQRAYFLGQETCVGINAGRVELVHWGCLRMWRRGVLARGVSEGGRGWRGRL